MRWSKITAIMRRASMWIVGVMLCILSGVIAKEQFILQEFQETRNSHITYLKDARGQNYLIKQKKDLPRIHMAIKAAFEALSAHIAASIGINTQHVWIVSKRMLHDFKKYPSLPATLHTVVPGKPANECRPECTGLMVKQRHRRHKHPDGRGFNYKVMQQMARHKDLPSIVALDTFIGNNDRISFNLFYDNRSDHFFVIDMEQAFSEALAVQACKNIHNIAKDESIVLDAQQKDALYVYYNTIKKLANRFTVAQLYKKFDYYLSKTGVSGAHKSKTVKIFKKVIAVNSRYIQQLLRRLKQYMKIPTRKYKKIMYKRRKGA